MSQTSFLLAADAVLILHCLFVLFVISGGILVFLGGWRKWQWTLHPAYRYIHLLATGFVTVQSWLGYTCPLTTLEMALRLAGKGNLYEGSFIQHWLQQLLYFSAPTWVFTLVHTLFAISVIAGWLLYPPSRIKKDASTTGL